MTASPLSVNRRDGRFAALFPYLLLALCQLFWAGNWVIGRAVRDTMPPVALNFWRWAVAALVLAPFALPRLRGKGDVLRRHWLVICLLGFIGAGFFQVAVYVGLRYTEAVNAVLMNSASPLFIILIAWLLGEETVTPRQLIGMVVSFFGIVVIMNRGDIGQLRHFHFNPGDLLILLAMPAWGVYSVLLRRRPPDLDGIGLLFAICVSGLVLLVPAVAVESLFFQAAHFSWAATGAVLYIGLFASVGAYICWNRGVELVGPNRAGFTMHLLPAFATVLAVLVLGEDVHLFHIAGIAIILFGVWLATSARSPRSA
jgi:drug/metabolite transporter (DMT)-like permease